jgi:ABC-2 type transport system ATP-binding protein
MRNLMKSLAAQGRTIFVSSHLMNEMAVTADHVVVIGRGKLIADTSVDDFVTRFSEGVVMVRSPQSDLLARALAEVGGESTVRPDGALMVSGTEAPKIGELAAAKGIVLHELTPQRASLEEAFMELTKGDVQFNAPAPQWSANPAAPRGDGQEGAGDGR